MFVSLLLATNPAHLDYASKLLTLTLQLNALSPIYKFWLEVLKLHGR
jgi:hypothetical protein